MGAKGTVVLTHNEMKEVTGGYGYGGSSWGYKKCACSNGREFYMAGDSDDVFAVCAVYCPGVSCGCAHL